MPTPMDPMTLAMLSGDPKALQTMRQYALAQQLQGMSLEGAQQPQQLGLVNSRFPHAARVGPAAALAPLAEALMARKGFQSTSMPMARIMGMAPPQQAQAAPLTAAPPATDPNVQSVQPLIQRAPGQSLESTVAASQPQAHGQEWWSIPGVNDNVARVLAYTDRGEWAKAKLGPESWQLLVRGFGGDEAAAGAAVQAKAHAEAFKDMRPGSTGLDFLTGQSTIASDPARGEQYQQTPQGVQAAPIPGSSEIQAQRAQDLKAAQEAVTPHYEPDPFHPGQMHIVYPPGPSGKFFSSPSPGGSSKGTLGGGSGGTAADLEQQKKGAESGQVYSDALNKNAENATELRASLAELKNLAKSGGVSASNPAKLVLGSYLRAAGMDPQTVGNMLHTDVGALVAASKQTGNLAINSIHKFTSRGSNFDLATFMRYNPNLDMGSQEGFQRVIDFMDRRLQQDVAKQADFDHFVKTNNIPPNLWASAHTAHWLGLQNKLIGMGATNSGAAPIAEDVQAEAQRRGF